MCDAHRVGLFLFAELSRLGASGSQMSMDYCPYLGVNSGLEAFKHDKVWIIDLMRDQSHYVALLHCCVFVYFEHTYTSVVQVFKYTTYVSGT